MKKNRIQKKYDELFSGRTMDKTISTRLSKMEEDPDVDSLREVLCDKLLQKMTEGYFDYPGIRRMRKDGLFQLYEENVKMLPETCSKHWMAYSCYREKEEELYKYFNNLVKDIKSSGVVVDEKYIVETLIIPLKDAVPGFWNRAYKKLKPLCADKGTKELCRLMEQYFAADKYETVLDSLLDYVSNYPHITVAKEYLAHTYEGMKRWKEQIAYLEGISDAMFYSNCMEQYYFDLAWAYGKLEELSKEEENYRNSIAINNKLEFANNNLGWCLYQQGKYPKAEALFHKCWKNSLDLPNSANNYLRVLITEGKNKEAKAFIKTTELKIDKDLISEVEQLSDKDTEPGGIKTRKGTRRIQEAAGRRTSAKKEQFSSERALEDELVAKLENNESIFGKHLKIYDREGKYGRQYIIPECGIVDILCEDYKGDIYVIELKKDSGYKDAYEQIKHYMKWFSDNEEFNKKNVYGVICLNSPSDALVRKVRKDDMVSLFEYHISYSEIK